MNSTKLGQKRKDRAKIAKAKVLKKRAKIREEAKISREIAKIRDDNETRVSPIRNYYD